MIADDFLDGYLNAGEEQAYGTDEGRQVVTGIKGKLTTPLEERYSWWGASHIPIL